MTSVQVHGDDIMAVIHVARIVGSIVMMLVIGLAIAGAVRQPLGGFRPAASPTWASRTDPISPSASSLRTSSIPS